MPSSWKHALTKRLQKIAWIYLRDNFAVAAAGSCAAPEPSIPCRFVPLTLANYFRVQEFREEGRVAEYRAKIVHGEVGFFAEHDGKMVGSIWATLNTRQERRVVRMYMPLMPQEALIHDVVTAGSYRGRGVGPFMLSKLISALLGEYGASRVLVDVNVRNLASLRMMEKAGLRAPERVFYLSLFGTLAFQKSVGTKASSASVPRPGSAPADGKERAR